MRVEQADSSKQHHTWDITDTIFPAIDVFDKFVEYPDGYIKYAYCASLTEARTHQSGWAARNANNHNQAILKKSCLGVLLCDRQCSVANGLDNVRVRPSICDKARKKQINQPCPNAECNGRLYLKPCRGHSGYPVTHFWREIVAPDGRATILFQAKGEHDHPRPERKSVTQRRSNTSNTSIAKQANENWTPCSSFYTKSVKRLKRSTNKSTRLTSISNIRDVIIHTEPQRKNGAVLNPPLPSVQCYPSSSSCQTSPPWSTNFYNHHQTRPTVIRTPQTQSLSCAWSPSEQSSQNIIVDHSIQPHQHSLPLSSWYDVQRQQPSYSCDKSAMCYNAPFYQYQQFQQQQQQPYQRRLPQSSHLANSHSWLGQITATRDIGDNEFTSGVSTCGGWNPSYGWDSRAACYANDVKPGNFHFDAQSALNIPGYTTIASQF